MKNKKIYKIKFCVLSCQSYRGIEGWVARTVAMTLDLCGRSSPSGLSSSSDFSLRRTGLGGGANGVDTLAYQKHIERL